MLRPGVTQEWVDESELPRERTKNRRWRRPYDVLAEATRGEVVVRVYHTRICMQRRCHQEATSCSGAGGIVRGNAIQAIVSREGQDHAERLESWTASVLTFAYESPTNQRTRPKLLGGHSGVEAGGRKGRGSDDESSGAQLPKSKASIRKEMDSEEHHSAAEADLLIAKEGMQVQGNG
ncbi:hypothetical protein BHE74_00031976 [Ensete ventricosum]|nr:hypothetical protein BHE74_00031976 [Ensete ventricosum]